MAVTRNPIVLTRQTSEEISVYPFDNGEVALFSTPSPDKITANEDAIALIPVDNESVVLAVADGAGGAPGGDYAAKIAIESLISEITTGNGKLLRTSILDGIETANKIIRKDVPGAATTIIVVEVSDQTARTYHVGDSGACLVGGRGKIKSYTVFHSPTGYAVESGLINETQAIQHEDRYLVSNILGTPDMSIEIGSPVDLAPRDTIVVASDGLFDNLYFHEIGDIACRDSAENACRNLVKRTRERMLSSEQDMPNKPDDLSILVFRCAKR